MSEQPLTDSERAELEAYRASALGVGVIPPTPTDLPTEPVTVPPVDVTPTAQNTEVPFAATVNESEFAATVDPVADAATAYRQSLTAAQLGHPEPAVEVVTENG